MKENALHRTTYDVVRGQCMHTLICQAWPLLTAGSPRARSTTKLSTTTSLQAVLSDPSSMAPTAAVGLCTSVASANHDALPARKLQASHRAVWYNVSM